MAEDSQVLKRLDFPAYCIKLLDNGLVAIAGGGGTSKTGVGNSIELGLLDYEHDNSCNVDGLAKFQSIHTFVPNDAIMKFVGFTCERQSSLMLKNNSSKQLKREKSSNSTNDQSSLSSTTKLNDLFIAAPVNNTIEIYKLVPSVSKHTNENNREQQMKNHLSNGSIKKRKNSSKNKTPPANLSNIATNNTKVKLETNAYLKLSNIVKMSEVDESLSDPFEDIPPTLSASKSRLNSINSKSAQNLFQTNQPDESITSLAVCKLKNTTCKNNNKTNGGILLCAGTSKGNIVVWNLLLDAIGSTSSTSNINDRIRYEKLYEVQQAHGKQEIDDLQTKSINDDQNFLLSIGRDNHCFVWSMKTFSRLNEIKYFEYLNNDSNQRMKHARFTCLPPNGNNENFLYTTFIPRIRGGGKDTSSYVVRWCFKTSNEKFSYRYECKRRIKNTIITTMQTTKDGTAVCIGDVEGRILLFDMDFNELANFKKQHSSVITDLAFCHDNSILLNPDQLTSNLDLNKLILSISIDRTLQCYKYINNSKSKLMQKFLSGNTNNNVKDFISTNDSCSLFSLFSNIPDFLPMSSFQLVFYFVIIIILFCHFFIRIE